MYGAEVGTSGRSETEWFISDDCVSVTPPAYEVQFLQYSINFKLYLLFVFLEIVNVGEQRI